MKRWNIGLSRMSTTRG